MKGLHMFSLCGDLSITSIYVMQLGVTFVGGLTLLITWSVRFHNRKRLIDKEKCQDKRLRIAFAIFALSVLIDALPTISDLLALSHVLRTTFLDRQFFARVMILFAGFLALVISTVVSHYGEGPGKTSLQIGSSILLVVGIIGFTGIFVDIPGSWRGNCGIFPSGGKLAQWLYRYLYP